LAVGGTYQFRYGLNGDVATSQGVLYSTLVYYSPDNWSISVEANTSREFKLQYGYYW